MSLAEISPFKKYDLNSQELKKALLERYGNYIPDPTESEKIVPIALLLKNTFNLFFSNPLLYFPPVNKRKVKKIELVLNLALFVVCIYTAVSDFFKFKNGFWKDPEYSVRKTIELAKKIQEEKLSYNQLEALVGTEATAFVHLSVEDLAYLLSYQIENATTYGDFRNPNRNFPLKYGSEEQLTKLKKLLEAEFQAHGFTNNEKKFKFLEDVKFFGLLPIVKTTAIPAGNLKTEVLTIKKIREEKLSDNRLEALLGAEATAFVHSSIEDFADRVSYQIQNTKNLPLKYWSGDQLAKLQMLLEAEFPVYDFANQEKKFKYFWLFSISKQLFNFKLKELILENEPDLSFFLSNEKYLDLLDETINCKEIVQNYFYDAVKKDQLFIYKPWKKPTDPFFIYNPWKKFRNRFGSIMTALGINFGRVAAIIYDEGRLRRQHFFGKN